MNKYSYSTLWLIALAFWGLCSCESNRKGEIKPATPTLVADQTGTILEWPKQGDVSDDFFASEIDSVKYIMLETLPKSMFGEVSQIYRIGDSLIIVDAHVSHSISVFNLQGEFCYNIGAVGRGPGEYLDLGYVHVSDNGLVYLADCASGRILTYTKEGKFVKEHILKNGAPQTFFILNDSLVIGGYSGYRPNAPYRLVWSDWVGNELETAFPYMTEREYLAGNFLVGENSETLFYYPLSDTIFEIKANSISPYLSMNFYEKNVLEAFVEDTKGMDDHTYLKELYNSDEITNMIDVFRCDNHWVAYSQKGKYTYMSVLDKSRRYYLKSDVKKKFLYIPDNFKASWHDWIIGYVNPETLDYVSKEQREDFLKSLSEACGSEITLDSLKQSNPVITMYHLKSR